MPLTFRFEVPEYGVAWRGGGGWGLGFGVWGLGFGVWGLGLGFGGLGFEVWGLGFQALCLLQHLLQLRQRV